MNALLIAPIAVPFATALVLLLGRFPARVQHGIAVAGTIAFAAAAVALLAQVVGGGVVAVQMGGWAAPFGITLVADRLGAGMVAITALIGLAVTVYSIADVDDRRMHFGYAGLVQLLLGGVSGAFLTGDVFNLYVWFEVMLIASFGLLTLGGERAQLDAGIKYVALNLIATLLFLGGAALLYGMTGTLNMADLHGKLAAVENDGLVSAVAVLFMVAFGIKAAVFPLFFWLPASYHTPPVAVTVLFSGLLTKVGVYALIRFFTLIFTRDIEYTHGILAVVAGFTMVTGVLGAAAQNEFRRILAFHIVSQIGYMVMGLALGTPLAIAGAIFYTLHNILAKSNLFLVSGVANRICGSFELGRIGGLYHREPLLSAFFLVSAFSLAGFPLLSGFWGKLFLVRAGLDLEAWTVVAVMLGVGLLTLYSMTKIWTQAFWKPHPEEEAGFATLAGVPRGLLVGPIAVLALLIVAVGVWPAPLFEYTEAAARELLDPAPYLAAVLGGGAR